MFIADIVACSIALLQNISNKFRLVYTCIMSWGLLKLVLNHAAIVTNQH